MRFLDFEAEQVDKSFKTIALTHAGFLAGLSGYAASLRGTNDASFIPWIAFSMLPFVFGLVEVARARTALIKSLRDAARRILKDDKKNSAEETPEADEQRGLRRLEASEVWAAAFPDSFKILDLQWAGRFIFIGFAVMFVVAVGEPIFKLFF